MALSVANTPWPVVAMPTKLGTRTLRLFRMKSR